MEATDKITVFFVGDVVRLKGQPEAPKMTVVSFDNAGNARAMFWLGGFHMEVLPCAALARAEGAGDE